MSKQIILLRHAQTAGKQAGQRDYDRVLTPEGEAQARKAGHHMIRNSLHPDILISSSALRARQTSLLINESTRLAQDRMVFLDTLYEADGDTWLLQLRQLDDRYNTVICVGHNPTLSWLASHLSRRPIDLAPAGWIAFRSPSLSWSSADQ
ncbi:MAG: histidine phosphatase family protein, partial [Cyclobacteriaceae bacterium]|nr:histidine phosphatase family protein [Cyclobacteriaceae bacterium]